MPSPPPPASAQVRRRISGKGTVIRHLNNGAVQLLFANGNVSTYHNDAWLVTNAAGQRTVTVKGGDVTEAPPLLCATNMDAETRAMVTTREDLVMTVCAAREAAEGRIRRERTSEAAPEAVRQAVGGGCQSGWGQLLSVTNAIEAGAWR